MEVSEVGERSPSFNTEDSEGTEDDTEEFFKI
jgi:hypothetical protein